MPDTIGFVCPVCRATHEVDAAAVDAPEFGGVFCQGRAFHDHDAVLMIREEPQRSAPPPIAGAIRPQDAKP
jgi:hypothetical protein